MRYADNSLYTGRPGLASFLVFSLMPLPSFFEKDWGKYTLQGIKFAFYILNEKFRTLAADGQRHSRTIKPGNTIVIASSVSNGAGQPQFSCVFRCK